METVDMNPWLKRLHLLSSRLIMPVMAVLFICTNTVFNLWIDEHIETVQNILALVTLLITACWLLSAPRRRLLPWLRGNILVIVYFIIRLISLWQCGFDYSVIRTICFEMFFLIGICGFTVNITHRRTDAQICADGYRGTEDSAPSGAGSGKQGAEYDSSAMPGYAFYVKFFVWFEVIMSALCVIIFFAAPHMGQSVQQLLADYTYYEKFKAAALFSNINTAGIMAGFSIVLAFILYRKAAQNKNSAQNSNSAGGSGPAAGAVFGKKAIIAFGLYNVFALIYFGSRAADVGILAVIAFFAVKKIFPKINVKRLAAAALCLMVLTLVPIYVFIGYHEKDADLSYTMLEYRIDKVSSTRYVIWKECFVTQQDDLLFGKGNLKLEQQARKDLMSGYESGTVDYRYFTTVELGPHNGYIGMVSGAGWLGLLLFIAIMLQRIRRSKNLEKGSWYLMLVFFFAINCFESLFILNRFFACFYVFLILESDWEQADDSGLAAVREQAGEHILRAGENSGTEK